MTMAFIVTGWQIRAYVLLFCLFNIFGGTCNGNVTDSSADSDDSIRKNSLAIEHGIIHVHDNDINDSTTNNECIATLHSSSVNETISDFVEDQVPSDTSSSTIASHVDDMSSTNEHTGSHTIMMKTHINIGFGEIQMVQHDREATQQRLIETLLYMYNNHTSSITTTSGTEVECKMQHELCAYWAARGECEVRPGYMRIHCAPTCFSCQDIIFEHRCPIPNTTAVRQQNAWQSGDLNRMFERIVTLYDNEPVRHSNTDSDDEYHKELVQVKVLSHPGTEVKGIAAPWVVQIEDFLTPDECDILIQLGTQQGYKRSTGLNLTQNADGTYGNIVEEVRTSTNAWCLEECHQHPTTQKILQRIEYITNISDANSEYLQLLHYDVGQFYKIHHDYIDFHLNRTQGVRLATVFLYLNDVEEGGGTNFPELNLTVEAKRGRALIWPSVFDSDPDSMDPLTKHQALPVVKGVKYGANSWIHQRNFKSPFQIGCTG